LTLAGFNVFLDKNSPVARWQREKHATFRLNYFDLPNIRYASREDVLEVLPKHKQKEIYYKSFSDIRKSESFSVILGAFFNKAMDRIRAKLKLGSKKYWSIWDENSMRKPFYREKLTKNTKIYMAGVYQKYYYLENMREELLRDFSFSRSMPASVERYKSQIASHDSVSIHARRGDYVHTKEHDICTLAYYKNAVEYIQKTEKDPVYYIFSDDLEWARDNFAFLDHHYVVDNSQYDNSDYYDLYLMSVCRDNIIANSTFSWWGAYLNKNPGKTVVCPDKWHGWNFILTDELCPEEWIRVPVS
jgi:hypothetical protein